MRKHGSSATSLCSTSEICCSSPRFFGSIARPCIGVGNSSGLRVDVVLVVRVVQHGVEVDLVDLGDGADVAGHASLDLGLVLAPQHEEVADLERLAAVADEELPVRA